MKLSALRISRALVSVPACLSLATLAALLIPAAPQSFAQEFSREAVHSATPVKQVHIMRPSSVTRDSSELRSQSKLRATVQPKLTPVNTGSGVEYTCDPNVATATCAYLNTTVAGWYNGTFTNANASIYITYGTTGLGESDGYENYLTYDQYLAALNSNSNKSAVQTSALSALNTYDTTPYGAGNVEITGALGTTLGLTGLYGITYPGEAACTLGTSGCYNEVIVITNDPGTPLYYDNIGGPEPSDAYDFYGVVNHETDEILGTSSCISTQGSNGLTDGCGAGTPSVVDLFRYSSAGNLVLDSSLSTTPGAYFSYNGGSTNGANGVAGTPKVYNTLDNGDDYADYLSSTPDCGTDIAVQDAEGCPGEDAGLSILNDGGSEITILNAVGFDVPATGPAVLTSPSPNSTLSGTAATFEWTKPTGATQYELRLGSTGVGSYNIWTSQITTTNSVTFTGLPANGETIYAQLLTYQNGAWVRTNATYTAATAPVLTSPSADSTLPGPAATFSWPAATGATGYELRLGSTGVGSYNVWTSQITTANSVTFSGLPMNGETIYAQLLTDYNGTWVRTNVTYTAATAPVLTSPAPGGALPGSSATFSWTGATGTSGYELRLGTTGVGSYNLRTSAVVTGDSVTFTGLPTNGETIYAQLLTDYNGTWIRTNVTYTAAASTVVKPALKPAVSRAPQP